MTSLSVDEWAPGMRSDPLNAGVPYMTRISFLAFALVLTLMIPASAQESKPSPAPSQNAQSKDACRAKCEAQYNENKECQQGVAPMHSPCELFNQCLSDCS